MQEEIISQNTAGLDGDDQSKLPPESLDRFNSEPVLIVESPEGKIENPWLRESEETIHDAERILAKPADENPDAAELGRGHFPHGLSPGLTTNRDSDDDSDIDSADVSTLSALTELSSSTNTFEIASISLVRFLANDETLRALCVAANSSISPEVFRRQYTILLRKYGCNLRREAQNHVQEQAARYIRHTAYDAARVLRRHFFGSSESLLHELLRYPPNEAAVMEDYLSGLDDDSCGSEDSASESEVNEMLPEYLDSIQEFLLGSDALKSLRLALETFLTQTEDKSGSKTGAEQQENTDGSRSQGEQARESGLLYLARTRSFPLPIWSLGFFTALFWRCYISCLSYMFSLISQANWEKYSRDQSSFKMIYIYDAKGDAQETTVRLDTGSDLNVISTKKLRELGDVKIDTKDHGIKMRSVHGQTYQPRCSLQLRWSLRKNTRIHTERFFVVDDCPEELLFSDPYIERLGLIRHHWEQAANMNVFDKKYVETDADRESRKRAKEEKLALEEKKKSAAALQKPAATSPPNTQPTSRSAP